MKDYLDNYGPVLSVNDVAAILQVSGRTVKNLIKRGELTAIKVGRSLRIPKDQLVNYLHCGP